MPRSSVSVTSTKCVGCRRPVHEHHLHAVPRLETVGIGEHPTVRGVAHRVDHCEPDVAVIGHVVRVAAPRVAMVDREHDLRPVPPDREREVAAQRDAVLDEPVGMIEELDAASRRPRPHSRAPRLRAPARTPPARSESIPASPCVASRYATSLPCAVQRAIAAAAPYSRSSGWATIASARSQSSDSGSMVTRPRAARTRRGSAARDPAPPDGSRSTTSVTPIDS